MFSFLKKKNQTPKNIPGCPALNLLPIGSVVILEEGEKTLMIIGIKPFDDSRCLEYDYASVLYPEGYIGNQEVFLFNHVDIKNVVFNGYDCDERIDFLKSIEHLYP